VFFGYAAKGGNHTGHRLLRSRQVRPDRARDLVHRAVLGQAGDPDDGFGEARLTYCAGEFPRTDERWATSEYWFGLINLTDVPDQPADDGLPGFRWLASIDPETGRMKHRLPGRGRMSGR
jgi:hypothetical protein